MKLEMIATATFGLEAVVRREVEALGYKVLKTEDGKVTYLGDERAIVRSNLWLRSADRVLLKMAEFRADEFEALFQQTKALPWEQLIPTGIVPDPQHGSISILSAFQNDSCIIAAASVSLIGAATSACLYPRL